MSGSVTKHSRGFKYLFSSFYLYYSRHGPRNASRPHGVATHRTLLAAYTTPCLQHLRCQAGVVLQLAKTRGGTFTHGSERGWALLWRYVTPRFYIPLFYFSFILLIHTFFITGKFDETTCFHCGLGLCDWRPTDDAWVEHVRWSPFCLYVYVIKGSSFVRRGILRGVPFI